MSERIQKTKNRNIFYPEPMEIRDDGDGGRQIVFDNGVTLDQKETLTGLYATKGLEEIRKRNLNENAK